jgi:hypothetical protein
VRIAPEDLIRGLSSAVDATLARQIIESYVEMQQRYLAGDWQPTELDGGRLCEAVARAVYQLDGGTVTHSQLPGELLKKVLDADGVTRPHRLALKDRQHLAKVMETVYKFRSDRGPVHISPIYTANGMDSMLVVYASKWILGEFLRLAWHSDRNVVGAAIEHLVQLQLPLIHELDGRPMVLPTGVSAPEEVLLLLAHAPSHRLTRAELRRYASNQKPQTVSVAISRLIKEKDIRATDGDEVALTPNGQKRLMEAIIPKWRPKL